MTRRMTLVPVCLYAAILLPACQGLGHRHEVGPGRWDRLRAEVKLRQARQHFEGRRFPETVTLAGEAIAFDPAQPDAYAVLARAHLELGRASSAQRVLDAAQRVSVASADLHYLGGVLYEDRNQGEEALREFRTARQLDPTRLDYLLAEAESLVVFDRATEALTLLDEHDRDVDDDGSAAALSAQIALLLGDEGDAVRRFRQSRAVCSNSRIAASLFGDLLVREGRCTEAVALLEPLVEDAENGVGQGALRRNLATCYLAEGDAASAKLVLLPYGQANPDDIAAQVLLTKAALVVGDIVTALQASDAACRQAPDDPEVRFLRAVVLWKRGRLAEAAGDLYDLLKINPQDVEVHCLLAELLREERKPAAAREHFEAALSADPQCAWAREGLRMLQRAVDDRPAERSASLTSAPADNRP